MEYRDTRAHIVDPCMQEFLIYNCTPKIITVLWVEFTFFRQINGITKARWKTHCGKMKHLLSPKK